MSALKFTIAALLAMAVVAAAFVWLAAGQLVAPAHADVGEPPDWLNATPVKLKTGNASVIYGWLALSETSKATIVLLHLVRANRRSMLGRARFLKDSGYSVLLIDHQAHGASDGKQITFGYLESHDAAATVEYARDVAPAYP